MKRLQVLLLVALSSALLLTGCGKEKEEKPEVEAPVVEQIIDDIPEEEEKPEEAEKEPEPDEDTPPEEGMVRSRITNEWVTEDVNNTRPLAIMTPNTKTASHYGISNADVCLLYTSPSPRDRG